MSLNHSDLLLQGAVVRPVGESSLQPFQQDWQMLQQSWKPDEYGMDLNLQNLAGEPASKAPRIQPWEDSLQATHANLFQQQQSFQPGQEVPALQQQVSSFYW